MQSYKCLLWVPENEMVETGTVTCPVSLLVWPMLRANSPTCLPNLATIDYIVWLHSVRDVWQHTDREATDNLNTLEPYTSTWGNPQYNFDTSPALMNFNILLPAVKIFSKKRNHSGSNAVFQRDFSCWPFAIDIEVHIWEITDWCNSEPVSH